MPHPGATLRLALHLRPEQMLARARFVAERRLLAWVPELEERRYARLAQQALPQLADAGPIWGWPPAPLDPAARWRVDLVQEILAGKITFLNQTFPLPTGSDWRVDGASRLWLFHLHGCRYAVDLAVAARRREPEALPRLAGLVRAWRVGHPITASDAWHPFVVAERLIAWLVTGDLLRRPRRGARHQDLARELQQELRAEVVRHALYLGEHLEHDAGGNHLLKNGVALLAAGCSLRGLVARRWMQQGSAILERELPRQVLADGGHYERSPMYHLLVLEDLLVALTAAGRRDLPVVVPLAEAVRRMQRFAAGLVHADGEIPLFNDAVLGEAPPPAALVGPSTPPGGPVFPDTGYALLRVSEPEPGGVLLVDCGPPGPGDLPAHVHADALSYELSVGQRRVIVDSGVASYEAGPQRDWFRGTAAHNTVRVDRQDQSEVWGAFRLGRRAHVTLEGWGADGACPCQWLVASHDGYARLGLVHERRVDAVPGSGWRIVDTLRGTGWHSAESRLQLAPGLRWQRGPDGQAGWTARDEAGRVLLRVEAFGPVTTARSSGVYAERFSVRAPTDVLCVRWQGGAPVVLGYWLLLPGGVPAAL